MIVDLNAARAERAAARSGDDNKIRLGTDPATGLPIEWRLQPSLAVDALELLKTGDFPAAMREMLADPADYELITSAMQANGEKLLIDDVAAIAEALGGTVTGNS